MTIEINGESFPLLPRVAVMLQLLMRHQGEIEQQNSGQLVFDYSESQVKIVLPPRRDLVKLSDKDELTK